jgi:protein-tyrosine phosphatase
MADKGPHPLTPTQIDYHCHLLPGIDDGPSNIEESVNMARIFADAGYKTVYCTPHMIKRIYDTDNDSVLQTLEKLRYEIGKENIPLQLLAGREYCLDENFFEYLNNPILLDGTRYLLIEIPPPAMPEFARDILTDVMRRGYIPMIAHPERFRLFDRPVENKKDPRFIRLWKTSMRKNTVPEPDGTVLLDWLREMGCAFQANLGSFSGSYGPKIQTRALRFQEANIYTHTGTDAHSADALTALFSPDSL